MIAIHNNEFHMIWTKSTKPIKTAESSLAYQQ